MDRVLLTGSGGFLGRKVARKLVDAGFAVRRTVRQGGAERETVQVGAIGPDTDWSAALDGCHSIVHLAAALPYSSTTDELLRTTNDAGTGRLVEQAAKAGIKSLVAMSTIFTVSGHQADSVVDDATPTQPISEYGRSKLAAEGHVAAFAGGDRCGISLRPPLIYGAEASGNWRLLQKLAATGLPLPFGSTHNRRTMISVDNLADAVVTTLRNTEPGKSGGYALGDTESLSLAEIISLLREGMGKPPRLVPVPRALIAMPLKLAGRETIAQSLLGDLEIDSSRFRTVFDWNPPERAPDAIRRSGREFAATRP